MIEARNQAFKALLLEMGRELSAARLPQLIAERLSERPDFALARVWLLRPGDICDTCHLQSECPDRVRCLHLVASAGRSQAKPEEGWSFLDGRFRRFPLGVRKVGRIASTGQPLEVGDVEADASWMVHPEWAVAEGIRGFGGQPLVAQGDGQIPQSMEAIDSRQH